MYVCMCMYILTTASYGRNLFISCRVVTVIVSVLRSCTGGGYAIARVPVTKIAIVYDRVLSPYGTEGSSSPTVSISSLLASLHATFDSIRSADSADPMRARLVNPVDKSDVTKDINYSELKMAFDTFDAKYNPFSMNIPNFASRFGMAKKIKRVEIKTDILNHYKSDKNMVLLLLLSLPCICVYVYGSSVSHLLGFAPFSMSGVRVCSRISSSA